MNYTVFHFQSRTIFHCRCYHSAIMLRSFLGSGAIVKNKSPLRPRLEYIFRKAWEKGDCHE